MTDGRGTVRPPDVPAVLEWINTPRPLSIHELRGRIILLEFWTFC